MSVTGAAHTADRVFAALRNCLAETFSIPPGDVQWSTHLEEELGLDSLDVVEVAATLLEVVGGTGELEGSAEVVTAGDLIELVERTRQ